MDVNCIIDAAEAVDAFSNNSYYTEWQLRCCLGPDSHKQTEYTNLSKPSISFTSDNKSVYTTQPFTLHQRYIQVWVTLIRLE